jgi:FKBP-type peptidyl-prolyl cis-trans isomerase
MSRLLHRPALLIAACVSLLLAVTGCGGSSGSTSEGSLDAVSITGAFGQAPNVTFDHPFATAQTSRRVVSEGDGEVLAEGATAVIDYAMVNGRDGTQFETSFGSSPASVVLDSDKMIPGLVKGLLGVKVGSRTLIGLAPDDAFKPAGGVEEAGVKADDTVLLVVDVKEVRHPLDRATGTPVAPPAGLPTVALDPNGKPTVTVASATPPPATLVVQPLIQGKGPAVAAGQTVVVHYNGTIWSSGKQYDSSWDRGQSASFPIGTGKVLPGWDDGLVGQPVGSQVLLVVPPDKGYGAAGEPSAGISGTDTLVFVVDILDAF